MVNLSFWGGVDCIGGNQVFLKDRDVEISFDFGLSYSTWGEHFEYVFGRPRSFQELRQAGLIPPQERLEGLSCCLISHGHTDHWRLASSLPEDSACFAGTKALKIIQTYFRRGGGQPVYYKYDHLEFDGFEHAETIDRGIEVEAYRVDHSIPDSYGFIADTSAGPIVYSGDFRLHGDTSFESSLWGFLKREYGYARAIICEGTNVGRPVYPYTEGEVRKQAQKLVEKCDCLALVDVSSSDIDRIRTFFEIAKANGRKFVVNDRIHKILSSLPQEMLSEFDLSLDEILRYQRNKDEIFTKPSEYLVCTTFYNTSEIREIRPPPGSIYILSSSEPYEEEREVKFSRLQTWLNMYGVPIYAIHSSGHVLPADLRRLVEEISPKSMFMIHTECPDACKRLLGDITAVTVPKRGESYVLT